MRRPGREETPTGPLDVINKCDQPLHECIGARSESEAEKNTISSYVASSAFTAIAERAVPSRSESGSTTAC